MNEDITKTKATRMRFRRSRIDSQGTIKVLFEPPFRDYDVIKQINSMTLKLHIIEPIWNFNPSEEALRKAIRSGYATEVTCEYMNVTREEIRIQLNKTLIQQLPSD